MQSWDIKTTGSWKS